MCKSLGELSQLKAVYKSDFIPSEDNLKSYRRRVEDLEFTLVSLLWLNSVLKDVPKFLMYDTYVFLFCSLFRMSVDLSFKICVARYRRSG